MQSIAEIEIKIVDEKSVLEGKVPRLKCVKFSKLKLNEVGKTKILGKFDVKLWNNEDVFVKYFALV